MRSRLLQVQAFVAILCLLCSVRPVFSQFFAEDWKIVRIGNDAAPSYLFPRHAIPLIAEKSNEHAQGFSSAINTFAETLCRNVLGSPKELTLTPIPPVTIGNTTDHTFNVSYRGVRIRGARMTITVGK